MTESTDHPDYYGGSDSPYETIKVIEAWRLDFCLGNALKYISRAGKKDKSKEIEDLEKAIWYIQRRISQLECWMGKTKPSWWVDGECNRCKLSYCCDHIDECRTKDKEGNWIQPCVAFTERWEK